jgi:zinc finger MYND domain-containing protein 15
MLYECQLCGADAAVPCPRGCGALFYCCSAHAQQHLSQGHEEEQCARMAVQVALSDSLRLDLPFPWTTHTVRDVEEGTSALCTALSSLGVHNIGPFRRECACGSAGPFGMLHPVGLAVSPEASAGGETPPADWGEYYALRGLPLESKEALWLDTALTLVHALAITAVQPRQNQLTVHLIGPRRELDQLPAFAEVLRFLAPEISLTLIMFGPDVPETQHRRTHESGRLRIDIVRCDAYDASPPPDLIFAPNAGVGAYPVEWQCTARAVLAAQTVPLCVSDFTQEAMWTAQLLLQSAGLHMTRGIQLNPFRKPACARGRESALPCYSNGWLAVFQGGLPAQSVS